MKDNKIIVCPCSADGEQGENNIAFPVRVDKKRRICTHCVVQFQMIPGLKQTYGHQENIHTDKEYHRKRQVRAAKQRAEKGREIFPVKKILE